MNKETDQRAFSRSPVRLRVEIETTAAESISGHTRDISMRGVYVYTGNPPEVGTRCRIRLSLGEFPHETKLVARGFVVRTDHEGIGVQFGEMDLESYHHLQNVVLYNALDSDRIDAEMDRPGFRPV